jgi:hypothetical protein
MEPSSLYLIIAMTALIATALLAVVGLKGFTAWIDLKRAEIDAMRAPVGGVPSATNRIEIADLKERLRKLEAIAAGVDL